MGAILYDGSCFYFFSVAVNCIEYHVAPRINHPAAWDHALRSIDTLPGNLHFNEHSRGLELSLCSPCYYVRKGGTSHAARNDTLHSYTSDVSMVDDVPASNSPRDVMPLSFSLELMKQNCLGDVEVKDPLYSLSRSCGLR